MKEKLLKLLVEDEEYENNLNNRANNAKRHQDTIPVIQEHETIIWRQKGNISRLIYRPGCKFKRFRDSNEFLNLLRNLGITRLIIYFKMNLIKLLHKFPGLKNIHCRCTFLKIMQRAKTKLVRRVVFFRI